MFPLRSGLLVASALVVGIASLPTPAGASALGDWRESPELITILLDGFEAGDACSWNLSVGLGETCAATVIEVQSGVHAGDVGLAGVFLTAFSADHKHFWAADALAGAAWNGVYFYRGPAATVLDGSFQIIGYPEFCQRTHRDPKGAASDPDDGAEETPPAESSAIAM